MAFNISNWLLRNRINAQARLSGRHMEHSRVVNPYHAVSIEPGLKCCKPVRKLEDRRFLAMTAPRLPLPECTVATCQCRYQHHKDRRSNRDRRVLPHNPHAHRMSERRAGSGRRMSD